MSARDDWLEQRRHGIGASDVAGILNLSPWATPFTVWQSKVLPLTEQSDEDNKSKRRGRILEAAVGRWAAEELDRTLTETDLIVHPDHDWARCTPDYFLDHTTIGREGLETKTTRSRWLTLPPHVELQALWCLVVTGLDVWHVAVYCTMTDDWDLFVVTREGNEDVLAAMMRKLGAWWLKHIIGGEAPPLDLSRAASQHLLRQHRNSSGRLRHAEQGDRILIDSWLNAKFVEAQAGKMRAGFEVQLKAAIGDDAGLIGDFGRVKWSRFDVERLDMKRAREDFPAMIEGLKANGYVKKTTQGRLNFTPKKEKK